MGNDTNANPKAHDSEFLGGIDNRLATVEGHIRAIRKMLEAGKCLEILTQLMAVESAVKKTGIILLKHHMNVCIKDAVQKGDTATVNELGKILEMYL